MASSAEGGDVQRFLDRLDPLSQPLLVVVAPSGTCSWASIGPVSTPSSTQCTVTPVVRTPAASASRIACAPGKAGSSADGCSRCGTGSTTVGAEHAHEAGEHDEVGLVGGERGGERLVPLRAVREVGERIAKGRDVRGLGPGQRRAVRARSEPTATTSGRRAGSSRMACNVVPLPDARTTSRGTGSPYPASWSVPSSSASGLSSPAAGIGERILDRAEQQGRRGDLAAAEASGEQQDTHPGRGDHAGFEPEGEPELPRRSPELGEPPGADRATSLPREDGADQPGADRAGTGDLPALHRFGGAAGDTNIARPASNGARTTSPHTGALAPAPDGSAANSGKAGRVPCAAPPTVTPLPTPTAKPGPARYTGTGDDRVRRGQHAEQQHRRAGPAAAHLARQGFDLVVVHRERSDDEHGAGGEIDRDGRRCCARGRAEPLRDAGAQLLHQGAGPDEAGTAADREEDGPGVPRRRPARCSCRA